MSERGERGVGAGVCEGGTRVRRLRSVPHLGAALNVDALALERLDAGRLDVLGTPSHARRQGVGGVARKKANALAALVSPSKLASLISPSRGKRSRADQDDWDKIAEGENWDRHAATGVAKVHRTAVRKSPRLGAR